MKYLYWRNKSLWCCYPLPGYPKRYPLKIYTKGSKRDKAICERIGDDLLSQIRALNIKGTLQNHKIKDGRLFEIIPENAHEYNPKYWRLVARYWFNHLRFKKTGRNEWYHLRHSLIKFGYKYAREINREDVVIWLNDMLKTSSINTVNNRFTYLCAAYNHSNSESNSSKKLVYNPAKGLRKIPGGNVRQFLLTPEKFERNYHFLKKESPLFSIYYLGLWETGGRPEEVALYEWNKCEIQEQGVWIPRGTTKTDEFDYTPFSDRLWLELLKIPEKEREGYIFKSESGKPWVYTVGGKILNNCYYHMKKLKKEFGEDAGWARDTRRGFVTEKFKQGFGITDIMSITRHKTVSMVQRYKITELDIKRKVVGCSGNVSEVSNLIQFKSG